MIINESTNFGASITEKDSNGTDTQVAYLSANLNGSNQSLSINVNIINKDLMSANAADVQIQYNDFIAEVKSRAKELGFTIFA